MFRSKLFFFILLFLYPAVSGVRGQGSEPGLSGESSTATRVSVSGRQILVNGHATTLVGFRLGSAPLRDDWTEAVIAELDLWKRKGINSFIIWLQGSSGGFARVVSADGASINAETEVIRTTTGYGFRESAATPNGETSGVQVIARARRIIEEADKRGIVVFVGFIYHRGINRADDQATITRAVATMAGPFRDYPNVILNMWNEANGKTGREGVQALTEYVRAVKKVAPKRVIAIGANDAETNLQLSRLPEVGVICHDMGGNAESAGRALGESKLCAKPVVNVESFGGRGCGYIDDPSLLGAEPQPYSIDFTRYGKWRRLYGVWRDDDYRDGRGETMAGRRSYLALLRSVMGDRDRQTHLMLHIAGWFQGGSRVELPSQLGRWDKPGQFNNVFHIGTGKADGTPGNPGIGWLLDEVERLRNLAP